MGSDNGIRGFCTLGRMVIFAGLLAVLVIYAVRQNAQRDMDGLDGNLRGEGQVEKYDVVNYDVFAWKDLPPKAQEAALRLGYTKEMWNKGLDDPPLFEKKWTDLSDEQREAAKTLGHDAREWWGGPGSAGIGTMEPTAEFEEDYWETLDAETRNAAVELGYNEELWDDGDEPPLLESFNWKDLTKKQQNAAEFLGYGELVWEDTRLELMKWDELPEDYKEAAKTLKYTQKNWDNMESYTREPPIMTDNLVLWKNLTEDQKEAAIMFGYDGAYWDEGVYTAREELNDEEFPETPP